MEFTKQEKSALEWLLIKGMEITNSNKKYEVFDNMYERLVNNLPVSSVVKSLPNKYCPQCGEPIKRQHKFWCEAKP